MSNTRREFLIGMVNATLVPVALGLGTQGCSESGGGGVNDSLRDGGPTSCSAITTRIALNHRHQLVVPLADVEAGNNKTYTLTDNGDHAHTVLVTAAQFAALASGTNLVTQSTTDGGHSHGVTLTCVGLV